MHTRERLMAIEPRDNGLIATTLRMGDEVVNTKEALSAIPKEKADRQMIEIAEKIINQQEGDFDPAQFTDRYEDALRALIEEKKKGKPVKTTAKPANDDGKVIDLMEALRKSLGQAPGKGAQRRKPAAKRGRAA